MARRMRRWLGSGGVVVLAAVAACANFSLLSTADEVATGQKAAAQVEQKATVYADPAVEQYVREFGARLVNACGRRDVAYRFTVLEDRNQVNAFAAAPANPAPQPPPAPAKRQPQGHPMICRNLTKGNVVLSRCTVADTRRTRARGLLGRHSLPPDEGMHLTPCRSIHMIGMQFPIDGVFLDKRLRVVALHRNVRPGRLYLRCGKARSTLEIAAGAIDARRIEVGDHLHLGPPPDTKKAP